MIIGFYHEGEKMYAIVDPTRSADLMHLYPKQDKPDGNGYVPAPSVDVELTEEERKSWEKATERTNAINAKIRMLDTERKIIAAELRAKIMQRISR
jgi:hypothetical protein